MLVLGTILILRTLVLGVVLHVGVMFPAWFIVDFYARAFKALVQKRDGKIIWKAP